MYGYSDYNGPRTVTASTITSSPLEDLFLNEKQSAHRDRNDDDDADDDMNPLQVGFWMEGDSMAPPCGTSISTIHKILEYLQLDENEILYDLGCGDGRICLEAWHTYQCTTIGIEVEADLVSRAQALIHNLSVPSEQITSLSLQNIPRVHCMDLRQIFHEWMTTQDYTDEDDKDNTKSNIKFPLPTIVFLYLLPEALLEIESSLLQILHIAPRNCRIVCNTWGIPRWKPIQETTIPETTAVGVSTTIYVYTADSVHKDT